ncbi:Hypothetical predicted protein [Olea europaea subsp. europaea]|uniref:Uncharacterized protein n=1 Tax=Olea europaea subsp. europaea TaxID=158383 RepID=A0A8S0RS36_OLEEU|nr:Hypothetical predicted protein [Olea europaea subsp. europaea]
MLPTQDAALPHRVGPQDRRCRYMLPSKSLLSLPATNQIAVASCYQPDLIVASCYQHCLSVRKRRCHSVLPTTTSSSLHATNTSWPLIACSPPCATLIAGERLKRR